MPLPDTFRVEPFIDGRPMGRFQVVTVSLCSAVVFLDGFDTPWSPSPPTLELNAPSRPAVPQ